MYCVGHKCTVFPKLYFICVIINFDICIFFFLLLLSKWYQHVWLDNVYNISVNTVVQQNKGMQLSVNASMAFHVHVFLFCFVII